MLRASVCCEVQVHSLPFRSKLQWAGNYRKPQYVSSNNPVPLVTVVTLSCCLGLAPSLWWTKRHRALLPLQLSTKLPGIEFPVRDLDIWKAAHLAHSWLTSPIWLQPFVSPVLSHLPHLRCRLCIDRYGCPMALLLY